MGALRLVVAGGSGFLGTYICKAGAARGWDVVSLSRSGEPKWENGAPKWAKDVKWEKADLLDPKSYEDKLDGADAVVHSMGILLEADYKGVLQGKEPIVAGLKKAFLDGGDKKQCLTYEDMNRDSAVNLAKAAKEKNAKTFAYVSAADGFPLLPSRYISTKREAEEAIRKLGGMRDIIVRPAFMYDESRKVTVPLAALTGLSAGINSFFYGKIPLLGAAGHKPLRAERVADATVEAISDSHYSGIFDPLALDELATKVWRRNML